MQGERSPAKPPDDSLPPEDSSPGEAPLVDQGRGLGLRLLALLGAVSFLMLGVSSLTPLLQPTPPQLPDQRRGPVG
jgi:hypothetical protein